MPSPIPYPSPIPHPNPTSSPFTPSLRTCNLTCSQPPPLPPPFRHPSGHLVILLSSFSQLIILSFPTLQHILLPLPHPSVYPSCPSPTLQYIVIPARSSSSCPSPTLQPSFQLIHPSPVLQASFLHPSGILLSARQQARQQPAKMLHATSIDINSWNVRN